jgi:hypothetical protein
MAKSEWTRWGRGECEGYSLGIGGGYTRFDASVSRSVRQEDGSRKWYASINGRDEREFASREEAMAHIEHELILAGNDFVCDFAAFRAMRGRNKYSQAIETERVFGRLTRHGTS